ELRDAARAVAQEIGQENGRDPGGSRRRAHAGGAAMVEQTAVAFAATTDLDFDAAVERCRAEPAAVGFGVLTEIVLAAKLREKLGVEREPYVILGACHPPSAHRAVQAAPEAGVLLPCNVTV